MGDLGSLTLEMCCTQCNVKIYKECGFWQCECYSVPVYELLIGAADIPKFWIDDEEMTDEKADAILRSAGYDPVEVRKHGREFAEKALAENKWRYE